MASWRRKTGWEQLNLGVLVGSALGTFAYAHRTLPAWLLLLPCAVSLFLRLEQVSPFMVRWVRRVAWVCGGGTVILAFILMAYPVLSAPTTALLTRLAGYSLALFSVLFLMGGSTWSPSSTLIPSTLGVFVVAAFSGRAQLRWPLLAGTAAIFAYLAFGSLSSMLRRGLIGQALWRLALLGLTLVATFATAHGIVWVLPHAQHRLEAATFGLYSTSSTSYSSLTLQTRLGDVQQLKLSSKVVMRVWTSRPQKLRGRVFPQFDGQGWQARELPVGQVLPAPPSYVPGESAREWLEALPGNLFLMPGHEARELDDVNAVRTKIVQAVFNPGLLVSPGEKLLVRLPVAYVRFDSFESLSPPMSSAVEIYGVINRREGEIVQAGAIPSQSLSECLGAPENTDPRLRELARELARGSPSAEERVRRTVAFVQNACRYSLEVGEFHSRQPVAEFLFEKKRGYCEYFASAAALLLRLQGVPCRYVTGFNVQEGNRQGGHYVVREADAHAWIEAYVPDQGWMEADPTPEAEYQALRARLQGGRLADVTEWMAAEWAEVSIRVRQGDWRAALRWLWAQAKTFLRMIWNAKFTLLFLLGLVAWLAVVRLAVRRRRRAGATVSLPPGLVSEETAPDLAKLMSDLDTLWAHRGLARPASRAPLEHLEGVPSGKVSAEFLVASRKVVESFYRASFGGVRVPAEETEELRRSVDRVRRL